MSVPSIAITIHNSVPVLNNSNWSQWSLAMQMFFKSANASHIISDSPPSPDDTNEASRLYVLRRTPCKPSLHIR